MRTSIPILTGTLALTVFLTSLVVETQQTRPGGDRDSLARLDFAEDVAAALPADSGSGTAPAAEPDDRLAGLLVQAKRFAQAGNLDGAAEIFRAVLNADPDERTALQALGIILFSREDYVGAEHVLKHLTAIEPDADVMYYSRLGVAQMRLQKYGPALESLKVVLAETPRDGALHFAFACIHARLMQTDLALHHFEIAHAFLGPALLPHLSDPHLDNLRSTERFARIAHSLRTGARSTALLVQDPDARLNP